jgi:diguanylate cyclase (GGDEF)-like protein
VLVRLTLALGSLPLVASCAAVREHPPRAIQGSFDLTQWQSSGSQEIRLDGEWGYYPGRLLAPGDPELVGEPSAFAVLPSSWDARATPLGEKSGHGYATYSLNIRLPANPPLLSLHISTIGTAYQLFVDGVPLSEVGWVATAADRARPEFRPQIVVLPPSPDRRIDLLLQVSNFHLASGGPWGPIWIGPAEAIDQSREALVTLGAFLAGSFIVFGISHLMLWAVRKGAHSMLYFAIVCFAIASRVATIDEILLVQILPSLSWASLVRIEYGSLLVLVAATTAFLLRLFPHDMPRSVVTFFTVGALVGGTLLVTLSPDTFSRGFRAFQIFCLGGAAVGSGLIGRAFLRKRDGTGFLLVGLLAITVTATHDFAVSINPHLPTTHGLFFAIHLQSIGLLIFVLSQAALLAHRSGLAVSSLRAANRQLDAHAHELEERVTERTAELERANRRLAYLAEVDALTNLGNRRFFEESLNQAWFDHLRRQAPLSLALIDVDCFKAYNDHYGHIAGDEALRSVASAVAASAKRPLDTVARYGGEEMVAVLPNTDLDGARHLAEVMRQRVEAAAIPHEESPVGPCITISVGVAMLVPRDDQEPAELVARADRALYRAKHAGRNRVLAAPPSAAFW